MHDIHHHHHPIQTTTTSTTLHHHLHHPCQLIWKYKYVLMILGVSCLYEISLTFLDYQMKILGWNRFSSSGENTTTFAKFMGRYGQWTNIMSLLFSSILFPFLMKRFGLRWTLRLFPTCLIAAIVLTCMVLPQQLMVLFASLSFLKAMTFSIHDPAKEILYLPTCKPIQYRAKFWIDVVGARIAKAMGSALNQYNAHYYNTHTTTTATCFPSILTAIGLYVVCHQVGIVFEDLIETGQIIGQDEEEEDEFIRDSRDWISTLGDPDDDDSISEEDDDDDDEDNAPLPPVLIELPNLRHGR